MNHLFLLSIIFVALSFASATEEDGKSAVTCRCMQKICPPCNPKAGCRIWRCPCTHDGFIMHPGNEPLNAPRLVGCPKCVSQCDNLAIKCSYPYLQCTAEQVATYKCIEPIEDEDIFGEEVFGAEIGNVEA
ncbi:hypothetical protein HA402_002611 [Bradysia odoriphaga]|nr:hypothetical protein HA402_002611 [Bradysia odoriphaga]